MLRFIVAIVMTIIIIKIAEDSPQIATGIMCALYIAFVIYSSGLADRKINIANRRILIDPNKRKLYYGMVVPVEEDEHPYNDNIKIEKDL